MLEELLVQGIGCAIVSAVGQEVDGRSGEYRNMKGEQDGYSDGETNDNNSKAPQTGQVANPTQVPPLTSSTTRVK